MRIIYIFELYYEIILRENRSWGNNLSSTLETAMLCTNGSNHVKLRSSEHANAAMNGRVG
jgi:hypothetical protein